MFGGDVLRSPGPLPLLLPDRLMDPFRFIGERGGVPSLLAFTGLASSGCVVGSLAYPPTAPYRPRPPLESTSDGTVPSSSSLLLSSAIDARSICDCVRVITSWLTLKTRNRRCPAELWSTRSPVWGHHLVVKLRRRINQQRVPQHHQHLVRHASQLLDDPEPRNAGDDR